MNTYYTWKFNVLLAEQALAAAQDTMKQFPKLSNGLHPDSVRALPEFIEARTEVRRAFNALQNINQSGTKEFKRRAAQERREARIQKEHTA